MNLSWEKINKGLLLLGLVALLYREGNFAGTFIPKPFEIIFVILCVSTALFMLKGSKMKDFFASIPRKILIAVCVMLGSVFLGWISASLSGMKPNFNMILELGTFLIGIGIFLLILFYAQGNKAYARYCLYAMLVPAIYAFFIFLYPGTYLGINLKIHFLGFTINPNTISKILLIPAMFFVSYSLFEHRNKWIKALYIFLSASMVSLIFWTGSRGSLVSLIIGMGFILVVYIFHEFTWKKIFFGSGVILAILILGQGMLPIDRQEAFVHRVVLTFIHQPNIVSTLREYTTGVVIYQNKEEELEGTIDIKLVEPRLIAWPFYLKYVLLHPLGIGPDTHKDFGLVDKKGNPINSGPHNTYLEIWLWGGILGILSFIYLLYCAFKNLTERIKSSFSLTNIALLAILFALSVSIFFDDSLSFYWFFIILAFALIEKETIAVSMHMGKEELDIFAKLSWNFKTVFDVGSRDDIDYFKIKNDCEYHLFEPNTEAIASIKRKISNLGEHNIILNEFGLSDADKDNCVYYKNVQSFIPHWSLASFDTGERFSLRKMDDYVENHGISFIDFLKIDVEGMDYQVILGGINTIKRNNKVSFIQLECSGGSRQYIELLDNFDFYLIMDPSLLKVINTLNRTGIDFNKQLIKMDEDVIIFLDKTMAETGAAACILGVNKNIDFSLIIQERKLAYSIVSVNKSYSGMALDYFKILYGIKRRLRKIRKTVKNFLFT